MHVVLVVPVFKEHEFIEKNKLNWQKKWSTLVKVNFFLVNIWQNKMKQEYWNIPDQLHQSKYSFEIKIHSMLLLSSNSFLLELVYLEKIVWIRLKFFIYREKKNPIYSNMSIIYLISDSTKKKQSDLNFVCFSFIFKINN
jgi:hypothetical protein